jgi:hypothetical protein
VCSRIARSPIRAARRGPCCSSRRSSDAVDRASDPSWADTRIPADHPLRAIRALADEALSGLSRDFDRLYNDNCQGELNFREDWIRDRFKHFRQRTGNRAA